MYIYLANETVLKLPNYNYKSINKGGFIIRAWESIVWVKEYKPKNVMVVNGGTWAFYFM